MLTTFDFNYVYCYFCRWLERNEPADERRALVAAYLARRKTKAWTSAEKFMTAYAKDLDTNFFGKKLGNNVLPFLAGNIVHFSPLKENLMTDDMEGVSYDLGEVNRTAQTVIFINSKYLRKRKIIQRVIGHEMVRV